MTQPEFTRRRLLVAAAGVVASGGVVGILARGGDGDAVRLPPLARGLPEAQVAWNQTLARDRFGNRRAPKHHRLLSFDLAGDPGVDKARRLEAALRGIERDLPYGPAGVLTAVGWGPSWFDRLGIESPVPEPVPLADTELPQLEDPAAVIHLASDEVSRLDVAQRRLESAPGLELVGLRNGSIGRGLARRLARRLELPPGVEPPADSPMLMGFESGRRETQARESDILVRSGPWTGSTTMHVSEIALTLTSWYRSLNDQDRIGRMFGPGVTRTDVDRPGPGLTPPSQAPAESARRHGFIGHAQAAAQARRNGRPIILRRDFDGEVDGQAVTHFVSYQESIADFVATQAAMNADTAVGINGVDQVINNGINEWLSVRSRANFLVPPRSRRSFPGLAGWDQL